MRAEKNWAERSRAFCGARYEYAVWRIENAVGNASRIRSFVWCGGERNCTGVVWFDSVCVSFVTRHSNTLSSGPVWTRGEKTGKQLSSRTQDISHGGIRMAWVGLSDIKSLGHFRGETRDARFSQTPRDFKEVTGSTVCAIPLPRTRPTAKVRQRSLWPVRLRISYTSEEVSTSFVSG